MSFLSNRDKPLFRPEGEWLVRVLTVARDRCPAAVTFCLIAAMALLSGCERREIIRPTPQMDAESQFWVRVLLAANVSECTVEVPSAFRIVRPDLGPGIETGHPTIEPTQTPTKVRLADGRLSLGVSAVAGNDVVISPEAPYVFNLNGHNYRGKLKLTVNRGGGTFDAVNLVPLEPYLAGVVGEEMPDYWEPQALRAQAIAARTYCLYIKNRFGVNRSYDVSRTQASQVYGGINAESSQTWSAVNSTYGQVLMAPGAKSEASGGSSLLGRGLFPAYYSSVCGGHTADSSRVFGDSFGPLKGRPCPYCKDVARLGLFFWPMIQYDRATITRQLVARYPKLKALGGIKDITIAEQSDYGQFSRLTRIKLLGATGKTDTLRAEDLRLALDPTGRKIKSTICHIVPWGSGWAFLSGRGWGHGVGMCQCGAQGMARLGNDAEAILSYYYPGSRIVKIY